MNESSQSHKLITIKLITRSRQKIPHKAKSLVWKTEKIVIWRFVTCDLLQLSSLETSYRWPKQAQSFLKTCFLKPINCKSGQPSLQSTGKVPKVTKGILDFYCPIRKQYAFETMSLPSMCVCLTEMLPVRTSCLWQKRWLLFIKLSKF